ncbi:hypothetical protein [Miltoncostaea oceani]|uniref:hypothetical protein n=1 Tax=Miltoncostaea oceani TaxID=2843216 RepID=UPI001C3CC79E|nr:hypothetical protein [Miltoncostaea oceani]
MKIDSNEAGEFAVQFKLEEALAEAIGDGQEFGSLSVYLDLDNNPATTGPEPRLVPGAEVFVWVYNNGSSISGDIESIALLDSFSSDPTTDLATWRVSDLRHLGMVPGQTIGVRAFSTGNESAGDPRDFVPNMDARGNPVWFSYQVSTAAPPPPPAAPVAAPITVAPPPLISSPGRRPISGSPLKLSYRAGKVSAQFGWSRASARVKWSLNLSARVQGKLRKKTISGSLQSAAAGVKRTTAFTVPVGTRIQGRLTVRSGSSSFTRSVFVTRRR